MNVKEKKRNRLKEAIQIRYARPHVTNMTKLGIKQLDWYVVPNSLYTTNVFPSD